MTLTLRKQIEERIKVQCASYFKLIAGSVGIEQIKANLLTAPSCFIYKAANQSKTITEFSKQQSIEIGIAVVICVLNKADSRGGDACDISSALQTIVDTALCENWKPEGFDVIEQKGGQLIDFYQGYHLYQLIFSTTQPKIRTNYYARDSY